MCGGTVSVGPMKSTEQLFLATYTYKLLPYFRYKRRYDARICLSFNVLNIAATTAVLTRDSMFRSACSDSHTAVTNTIVTNRGSFGLSTRRQVTSSHKQAVLAHINCARRCRRFSFLQVVVVAA